MKLAELPKRKTKTEIISTWNLRKPGGWDTYKDLSDKAADKIESMIKEDNQSIDEVMDKILKVEKEIKFTSFGKTRMSVHKKKHKCEDINEEDILRNQCLKIEEEINKVKDKKLGRVGQIFKIKESINGPKKGSQDPTAVRHPVNGNMVVSKEEIKKVTLCQES